MMHISDFSQFVASGVSLCDGQAVDLERYGMDLNLDGVEIAKLAGIKDPRLFMTEDM